MFDFSWGEIVVLSALGAFTIGRKDLPKAAKFAGFQLGRAVGLMQGARAKADRYAVNNELRALQNELRSGLRELDAVKGEMALTASSGIMGRGLGSTMAGANRVVHSIPKETIHKTSSTSTSLERGPSTNTKNPPVDYLAAATAAAESGVNPAPSPIDLAPREHAVTAVAEEEWNKRGIGFVSQAEMGAQKRALANNNDSISSAPTSAGAAGGSFMLADIMQQSLIHDQYDRAMKEQDDLLQSRIDKKREEHQKSNKKE